MSDLPVQRTPRLSRLVILLAAALLILFIPLTLITVLTIPNQKSLMTPVSADAPAYAAEVEARVMSADPSRGETLFSRNACNACHLKDTPGTGPSLTGMGERSASRRPNYSAAAYLYESITEPNAFIAPDYPAGVMLQNFKTSVPETDLYDLIAWLLTQ